MVPPRAPLQGSVRCNLPLLPRKGLSRSRGRFPHVPPRCGVGSGPYGPYKTPRPTACRAAPCLPWELLLLYRDRLYKGFLYRVGIPPL